MASSTKSRWESKYPGDFRKTLSDNFIKEAAVANNRLLLGPLFTPLMQKSTFLNYPICQVLDFQEHLVATMMALEDTYFSMAEKCSQNCLIIADRGVMDASAFIARDAWDKILTKLSLEDIEISDNRYNHVVHLQSAAIGAEKFYTTEDHTARFEGLELARERDNNAMEAWRDHPYVDIIDNRLVIILHNNGGEKSEERKKLTTEKRKRWQLERHFLEVGKR